MRLATSCLFRSCRTDSAAASSAVCSETPNSNSWAYFSSCKNKQTHQTSTTCSVLERKLDQKLDQLFTTTSFSAKTPSRGSCLNMRSCCKRSCFFWFSSSTVDPWAARLCTPPTWEFCLPVPKHYRHGHLWQILGKYIRRNKVFSHQCRHYVHYHDADHISRVISRGLRGGSN